MNCEEFLKLSNYQQSIFMASLIHTCISDNANFQSGLELIELGKRKGLFEDVKIGHEQVFTPMPDIKEGL